MEGASAQQDDGEPSNPGGADEPPKPPEVIAIAEPGRGDVILDVTFLTSKETLKAARKALTATNRRLGKAAPNDPPKLSPKVRVAFLVDHKTLKARSKYFSILLGNTQFSEARRVKDGLSALVARQLSLAKATPADLPWVAILDDDEASREARREAILEDLLRILHDKEVKTPGVTVSYVAALALLADRFDCTATVSRGLTTHLKFRWPLTRAKPIAGAEDSSRGGSETEQILRQKILIAWLLDQPLRLHNSTRELIMRGSRQWGSAPDASRTPPWWDLPSGLEGESLDGT